MPLPDQEDVVRAICTDKWDGERVAPSAFTGPDTSVSRLAITSLADHWEIFRSGVEKPPERWLERIAQINAGTLGELGRTHNPASIVTVEPMPEDWNPAHAIIPGRRSRGLANRIIEAIGTAGLHRPSPEFERRR